MKNPADNAMITLDVDFPIWDYFFTVAPLVIVGSKEGEVYDLAPKHLAMPMDGATILGLCAPPGTEPITTLNITRFSR